MDKNLHKERTHRIQDTGGRLRGGTKGNVWEWGPKAAREESLMEMTEGEFDAYMEHCEDVFNYEQKIKRLTAMISAQS